MELDEIKKSAIIVLNKCKEQKLALLNLFRSHVEVLLESTNKIHLLSEAVENSKIVNKLLPKEAERNELKALVGQLEDKQRQIIDGQSQSLGKYKYASETFVSWLRTAEDKLASLKPVILKKSQLNQQLNEMQAFRTEVWKRSGEYYGTKSLGDAFLSSCDFDKDHVMAELQDMKERWEKLNNDLLSGGQTLENWARRLGDFNEELRDLDHAVGRCEDRSGALADAAKDPLLLERVKTIREDAAALKKPLQSLIKLATDIGLKTRNAGVDAEHLKDEVKAVADRIDDLHNGLDNRCGELQSAATAVKL